MHNYLRYEFVDETNRITTINKIRELSKILLKRELENEKKFNN